MSSATPDDDGFVRITLRIPATLHAKLNEAAAKKRSMNAEIIARLERSFPSKERGMDDRIALLKAQEEGIREQIMNFSMVLGTIQEQVEYLTKQAKADKKP